MHNNQNLRPRAPSVQVDAFILQGPPEALDEDAVDAASFTIHAPPDANARHADQPL